MAKTPKDKTKGRPPLSAEDRSLWAYVLRDVLPLSGRRRDDTIIDEDSGAVDDRRPSQSLSRPPSLPLPPSTPPDPAPGSGLDRRNANRLRRGQMAVEATLDLHGLRQAEAQAQLVRFLSGAHRAGQRCVLVITGKGNTRPYGGGDARSDDTLPVWMRSGPGILRQSLPQWVQQDPLRAIVLDLAPAKPRDGGSGAFYVLLRRDRG